MTGHPERCVDFPVDYTWRPPGPHTVTCCSEELRGERLFSGNLQTTIVEGPTLDHYIVVAVKESVRAQRPSRMMAGPAGSA
jgi:hypothetical protein